MYILKHPAWIAGVLSGLGAVIAIVAAIVALKAALRLRNRLESLADSPVLCDLQALDDQARRLESIAPQVAEHRARAEAAIESIRTSLRSTGLPQAIAGLRIAVQSLRGLSHLLG